jgi:type II secretory pathway pseudopilin PulG
MLKMMSRSFEGHHNICGLRLVTSNPPLQTEKRQLKRSEAGYTLVALLGMMTVLALFAMAVAPRVQQQALREREREAIFRGEQIADAIRVYYINRSSTRGVVSDQALPSSLDQLLAGIPIQGAAKNRQILRASAARDPLSIDGEWRFIAPRGEALVEFQQSVMIYAGNVLPIPRGQMAQLQQFAAPPIVSLTNLGTSSRRSSSASAGDTAGGPFVGVASNDTNKSVLTYYGIETHDGWIFTPLFRSN